MMDIPKLRLLNQQLANPLFHSPKELVSWMGAVQAQDYAMVKWAVGMRLASATVRTVEEALQKGEILRTHVMRPTWHLVAAEDIRWMLKLSARRIKAANEAYAKGREEISEELYSKSNRALETILAGKKRLTRLEIAEHFRHSGLVADNYHMTRFMVRAEVEGIVCGGESKGGKHAYMLLEECVPPVPDITKDEALARLARNYFRSHTPATFQDFVWWSGLSVTEAKQGIYLIGSELTEEQWKGQTWYLHDSGRTRGSIKGHIRFLPPYDELLLGYKDRTDVLPSEHYSKAFTGNGLFFPVILYEGQIVGNWDRKVKRNGCDPGYSLFRQESRIDEALLDKAQQQYMQFLGK